MTGIQIFHNVPIVNRAEAVKSGERLYFTGEACRNGHVDKRYVKGGACRSCLNAATKRRRSRPDVKEHNRKYTRMYYQANKEDILSRQYKSRRNGTNDRLAYEVNWRRSNVAKARANSERWRIGNLDADAAKSRRRRAVKFNSMGDHNADDVADILMYQGEVCAAPWCGASLLEKYDVDHITPLSRGGSNSPDNLQCLCPSCNRSKGAKTMEEWIGWRVVLGLSADGV